MTTPTLTVHAGWDAFGVPDFSPFCLKVKTYLRMAHVPYASALGDPRKAPTKKIPFIVHDGTTVGDSGLILEYLQKKKLGDALDARLTPEEHALGHLVRRTCEESLYFAVLHTRWADDAEWPALAKQFKPIMPPVIGGLIINMIRKDTLRNVWGQGLGRHTVENVHAHGKADVDALATVLGDKPYLFGNTPTSYDATLFGTIANVLAHPPNSPIALHAKGKKNLVAFVERVKEAYWSTPDTNVDPAAS
jgi:glutathione S-transferase